jgi:drug/metabolite transporter (DMT)-like permease
VSPSVAAVVVQVGVPFTALLSVLMLGERIHWRRGIGLALTVGGVLIIAWNPGAAQLSWGALLLIASAFAMALGTVMTKQVENVSPLRFQAWVALPSLPPLILASALYERNQIDIAFGLGWRFVVVAIFAGLAVSVFAHTIYLWLLRRYEANLVAPLTLMSPLMTFGLGAALTGDRFGAQMIVGTALALLGVLIVMLRARPLTGILAERDLA